MNRRQIRAILRKNPFCIPCSRYEIATDIADDGTPLCRAHYRKYIEERMKWLEYWMEKEAKGVNEYENYP